MIHRVTVELPDDIYQRLHGAAQHRGLSPALLVQQLLAERYPAEPEAPQHPRSVRDFFGADKSTSHLGADNEQIDADLAREYGSTHEE